MPQHYSDETQGILEDFLTSLETDDTVSPVFAEAIQQMVRDGELGTPARIRQAIVQLERGDDELQD